MTLRPTSQRSRGRAVRFEHGAPGDRACPRAPGDRACSRVPGDRACPSVPGERASPRVPGDRASPRVPGDRTSAAGCRHARSLLVRP